jgi:hypothetical protein
MKTASTAKAAERVSGSGIDFNVGDLVSVKGTVIVGTIKRITNDFFLVLPYSSKAHAARWYAAWDLEAAK